MKKSKLFFLVSLGVVWQWVIIPVFFFLFLPKGKYFLFIFPHNKIIDISLGFLFLLTGIVFTISSFVALHKRGTMLPKFPPEYLITNGVYQYCRNPMYLGYSFLFIGSAFLLKNISFLFISLGVIFFILVYTKLLEEKGLVLRFGEKYLIYKKTVPFIVPFNFLHIKSIKRKTRLYQFFVFSSGLFLFQGIFILKTIFLMISHSDILPMIQIVLH